MIVMICRCFDQYKDGSTTKQQGVPEMSIARKSFSLAKANMPKLNLSQGLVEKAHSPLLNKCFSIKSQKGVTMIEYALIASLVAVASIVILGTLGGDVTAIFTRIANTLAPAQ
jgi:pilus assembly protein Flp/PilA